MSGGAEPVPRALVPAVLAISTTGIMTNPLVLPVLPDIARDLGVSSGTVTLVIAAASLPGVVVAPFIGISADRFGRRAVVVPCLVVFGVAGLAGAVAPNFPVLLATRFVLGIGAAGLINLAVVILGDHFSGATRSGMIGRNAVALTLGLSVFPTLGGALGDRWGWQAAFAPFGLAFVVAALAARVLPAGRPGEGRTVGEQLRGAAGYVRDRRVYAMTAAGFTSFVLVFGVAVTLPIHLDAEFAAGPLVRGLVLALPAVGAGTMAAFMGRLARRFGAWDLVPVGFALLAAAYAGVGISPAIAVVALPALAYGFGEALTIVPLQDYATALAPDEHRGVLVAVWVSAVRAGQAAGAALAGLLIVALGTEATFAFGSLLGLMAAAVAAHARHGLALRGLEAG